MINNQKILMCGRHKYGFFSCCSVKLAKILNFVNQHNECPDAVYDSRLFEVYKEDPLQGGINHRFFKVNSEKPALTNKDTFPFYPRGKLGTPNRTPYRTINFSKSKLWINHYFEPNEVVYSTIDLLNQKYGFNNKNICSICYRGLDKYIETPLGSYDIYLKKADEVLSANPDITFFVQTDEQEFLEVFLHTFPTNTFYCDETKSLPKSFAMPLGKPLVKAWPGYTAIDQLEKKNRINYSVIFLSIIKLMSQSKIVITHSGNVGLWTALYRNNTENFHQFLNDHWE